MPPVSPPMAWHHFTDFTPGIMHKVMGLAGQGSVQPLGAADAANTYRCIALPSGGLAPLPKRTFSLTRAGIEASLADISGALYRISGFHVTGPILAAGANGPDNVEFHLAYEYLFSTAHNGTFDQRRWRWERTRGWEAGLTVDSIASVNSAEATPAANFRRTSFADCRMHPTDATQIGFPLVAAAWYAGGGGNERVWKVYPDPNAPAVQGTLDISTTLALDNLTQHQGRLVGLQQIAHLHGTPGTWSSNEQAWWTKVNLPTLSNAIAAMFGQGQMSGYSGIKTVSAQELVAIKHRGGGLSIGGDLDNPTITALPDVISGNSGQIIPCDSPVGLIYAVIDGGIYAWQGGHTSTKLSPTLDDNFWRAPNIQGFINTDGKLDTWGDWIMVTGNWLYDTVTSSWWKIEDPSLVNVFQWAASAGAAAAGSMCYGAPITYDGAANNVVAYGWNKRIAATTYRWKSQYISPGGRAYLDRITGKMGFVYQNGGPNDRVIDIREITLQATGPANSTVTVTLSDEAGNTQAEVFTITSVDIPKIYRKATKFQCTAYKLQIDANGGGNASTDAPTVFDIGIGVVESQGQLNG